MQFRFVENAALPKLAWLAEIEKGGDVVLVRHGAWVDTRAGFFFEGAWAGDFESGGFRDEPAFGSGAYLDGDAVVFCPPDHVLDRIFFCEADGRFFVSNSHAFLLARIDDDADPLALDYGAAFNAISTGVANATAPMRTGKGRRFHLLGWQHLKVSPSLEHEILDNYKPAEFSDYASYLAYMRSVLGAVFQNAQAPTRKARFTPLATLSSGYDSNAIAAMAQPVGCEEGVTFTRARGGRGEDDDSGKAVGDALGMRVIEAERLAYLDFDDMPEIYTNGLGSEMSSVRDLLPGRIVLSGYMGDSVWERRLPSLRTDVAWALMAGHNQNEMRLEAGFINLPAPFIAVRQLPEINRISNLDEMRPWTLDKPYDRPICRRVLEEAGVPGDAFGQDKKATGVYYLLEGLDKTMTPQSYRSFMDYVGRIWTSGMALKAKARNLLWALRKLNLAVRKRAFVWSGGNRLIEKLAPVVIPNLGPFTKGSFLFYWATSHLVARYAGAMAAEPKSTAPADAAR